MNSYDDDSTYRGRSRSRHGRDADYPGGQDGYDEYSGGSAGGYADEPRTASGRARVGGASVSPAGGEPAASGRATVGRASVPGVSSPASGPSYGQPYGAEPTYGAPYGDASYAAEPPSPSNDRPGHDPYAAAGREPYEIGRAHV